MTEDDAKTKWCPHSRVGINAKEGVFGRWHNFTANRFAGEEVKGHCNCLASKCMCWKWDNEAEYFNSEGDTQAQGHCGLTGAK